MLKCVNLIKIRFYAYLYASCFLVLWHVQIDIVWYIFETRFETKIFTSWIKATLLRIYFRNLSVHRSFLQYKSQCKRLLHDIFHIGPGISPRLPYQARQRSWRVDMGRGLIPGTIWKISCHNLFITYFTLPFSPSHNRICPRKMIHKDICIKSYFNQINTFQHIGIKFE
jgi:hypothetical protein